jgi:hypothetical protein
LCLQARYARPGKRIQLVSVSCGKTVDDSLIKVLEAPQMSGARSEAAMARLACQRRLKVELLANSVVMAESQEIGRVDDTQVFAVLGKLEEEALQTAIELKEIEKDEK